MGSSGAGRERLLRDQRSDALLPVASGRQDPLPELRVRDGPECPCLPRQVARCRARERFRFRARHSIKTFCLLAPRAQLAAPESSFCMHLPTHCPHLTLHCAAMAGTGGCRDGAHGFQIPGGGARSRRRGRRRKRRRVLIHTFGVILTSFRRHSGSLWRMFDRRALFVHALGDLTHHVCSGDHPPRPGDLRPARARGAGGGGRELLTVAPQQNPARATLCCPVSLTRSVVQSMIVDRVLTRWASWT